MELRLFAFLVHLAPLHFLNKYVALDLPSTLFTSPLQILYTPFSVVLVAEIYLLVYYLPSSFGRSMGKQIEIIALIEIRTVFKDLDNTSTWPWEVSFFPHILSALLLGGIFGNLLQGAPPASCTHGGKRSSTLCAIQVCFGRGTYVVFIGAQCLCFPYGVMI